MTIEIIFKVPDIEKDAIKQSIERWVLRMAEHGAMRESLSVWVDMTGSFYTALFWAIQQADEGNLCRLAQGFPEEVEAYKVWTRQGQRQFLDRCSSDHPLISRLAFEAIGD